MLCENAGVLLCHERTHPRGGDELARLHLLRKRRKPAGELLVRGKPVAKGALIAVVELDDPHLFESGGAIRGKPVHVAEDVLERHLLEEIVPTAPPDRCLGEDMAGGHVSRPPVREHGEKSLAVVALQSNKRLALDRRSILQLRAVT